MRVFSMMTEILWNVFLPFAGTTLGAACVFVMKGNLHVSVQRALTGFAAGVMVAASIWSLLWNKRWTWGNGRFFLQR